MRYLGSKDDLAPHLVDFLEKRGLLDSGLRFFDAFCGIGSVADALKGRAELIVNDILVSSTTYTLGRLFTPSCTFDGLGFDPFSYLDSSTETLEGFMFHHYSPGGSNRMYFTAENASRIDFFREQIKQWNEGGLLNFEEHQTLLASLISAVSFVSNTAGVYGAFLKHWDSRALKPIRFLRLRTSSVSSGPVQHMTGKVEHLIHDVPCDILYLDPPYTQNQYGTQYHLLETLILDDKPSELSEVTGSRYVTPTRSDWSIELKVHIAFERVIAKTQAKHILFSYSTDGFLSPQFVESCLKRYGNPETYAMKRVRYKRYQNWKTDPGKGKEHEEILYYIEKIPESQVVYNAPFSFPGNKARLMTEINSNLPSEFQGQIVDAFGGGLNVGINIPSKLLVYNDHNKVLCELLKEIAEKDTYKFILYINRQIKRFGLEAGNKDAYIEAREKYNSTAANRRNMGLLYTIICYGFNQQIRFNSKMEFNIPVGQRYFNDLILEKLISFSRTLKDSNVQFSHNDFRDLPAMVTGPAFWYFDPPYLNTNASYNDGARGFSDWKEKDEKDLMILIDDLNSKDSKFMLSYVMEHNGVENKSVRDWVKSQGYNVIELGPHRTSKYERLECLITNYTI